MISKKDREELARSTWYNEEELRCVVCKSGPDVVELRKYVNNEVICYSCYIAVESEDY